MRLRGILLAAFGLTLTSGLAAQESEGLVEHGPLEIESYYQIRWGDRTEFVDLYKKNHLPILEALQEEGVIEDIEIHFPIQHIAGPAAWNMRVRITFRDPNVGMLGSAHANWVAAQSRLYSDKATFGKEEAHRMSLLESHWDVPVYRDE